MNIKDPDQVQKAEVIISHYFKLYNFFKKYIVFAIWWLIWLGIFLYFVLRPDIATINASDLKDGIWYTKLTDGIKWNSIYITDTSTNIWDFSGDVIGGYFVQQNGSSYSKWNLLYYNNIPLPYDFIAEKANTYIWTTSVEKVTDYIKYFIDFDDNQFDNINISWSSIVLPQVDYKKQFSLGCMESKFKIFNSFCDYNLEYFASNLYKYDVSYDFNTILEIFNKTDKEHIRNYICTSVSNYEMLTRNIDKRFNQIFEMCDDKFKTTHTTLTKFDSISKQLDTTLDTTLDTDRNWDLYKLVSVMWRLQQQINNDTIELWLLNTYQEFVSNLLRLSVALDQFYIDLIYRYHNQRLLPWLEKLQSKVNLTTVQDIKNTSNKIDSLNYSDGQWYAWLYNMVDRSIIMDSDYAVQNGWFGALTTIDTNTQNNNQVADDIINTITNIIDNWLNNNWTNQPTTPDTIIDNTNTNNNQPTTPDTNNDLNTYTPTTSASNTYNPSSSSTNSQDTTLKAIQNRFTNYIGINPTSATARWDKQYVVFDHQGFNFWAMLDMSDDWKLSPMYVKIDWAMVTIPDLEIYLMDYDRYTQIRFLKNTADYVRSANQNQ